MRIAALIAGLLLGLSAEVWHVVRAPGGGCLPPACRDGQWPMATPVLFHGNRFVMIGDGAAPQRSYVSSDGAEWRMQTSDAGWGARFRAADASFGGSLWRAGGLEVRGGVQTLFNDVWRSDDGVKWRRVMAAAPWSARADAHLVAFRDSLWLIGGDPADQTVWSTRDGVAWTAHRTSGLSSAAPQAVVDFDGALWIIGHGQWDAATNDLWTSTDGAAWRRVADRAPWNARTYPGIVVARNRIWVIGGVGQRGAWSSPDGRRWEESPAELPGPPRAANFLVSDGDAIWVFGGKTGGAGGTGFWDGIYVLR